MFDDDWGASEYLFPRPGSITSSSTSKKGKQAAATQPARPVFLPRPPVTLLVMSVGGNIVFDPTREELAVADAALAVSFGEDPYAATSDGLGPTSGQKRKRNLRLLAVRTVDPPSRLTAPGVPDTRNPATWAGGVTGSGVAIDKLQALQQVKGKEEEQQRMQRLWRRAEEEDEAAGQVEGVWRAPRGGAKAALLAEMVERVLEEGGVAEEILDALEAVDVE